MQNSLLPYNTFGIDAKASAIFTFQDQEELRALLKQHKDPLILGGGSNILLTQNVSEAVLINEVKGIALQSETASEVVVECGGGEEWHAFVLYCLDQGWFGIENMSLIPGSVGASPMQNIGAYGVEIKDVFHSLRAINRTTGEERVFTSEECDFGYRTSVFKTSLKGQYVITHVSFTLSKVPNVKTSYGAIQDQLVVDGIDHPSPKDVSNAVIKIRQSKLPDPKEVGNSGSFFKNPVVANAIVDEIRKKHENVSTYPVNDEQTKVPAGWLIEQAGWKGKTFGNYGVYPKQALVLVNYGGAKGADIYNLSEQIIQDVKGKFGITLEREVNIL